MSGPLAGVRVLDLTSVVMGPYATMMLGDLGADIIKVETPEGDTTRLAGPAKHPGMGAVFLTLGRNKRSLVLDLKQPAAMDALRRLCRDADVLVHSMRPDAARRLGIDYAALKPLNPRLIHCAAYGFREGGPYSGRPAYDDMIQGASGVAAAMSALTGEPAYAPMIFADKTVGVFLSMAISSALYARERSGVGQEVRVPMFETMVAFNLVEHLYGATFEPPMSPPGYARVMSRERKPFRTRDGYLCALPYTDRQFEKFFALAGRPELAGDARFKDIPARLANVDALYATVGELMAQKTSAEWQVLMDAAAIPCMPVATLAGLMDDPQLAATGFFQHEQHPTEGAIRHYGIPLEFADTPGSLRRPAPRLGEHSIELLREAGLDEAAIAAMLASRATVDPSRGGP